MFVFCEAMKSSGRRWPVISEEVQERCLARMAGCVRFIERLAPQLQMQATSDAIGDHPWQQTLAYVNGRFKGHGPSAALPPRPSTTACGIWAALTRSVLNGNVPVDINHLENLVMLWAMAIHWQRIGRQTRRRRDEPDAVSQAPREPWATPSDVIARLPTQLTSCIDELPPHSWRPPH